MPEAGDPIAYTALQRGVPVFTRTGQAIGPVERVLAIEAEDIFRGIVVSTGHGQRFIDRDRVAQISTTRVLTSLTDAAADELPEPPEPQPIGAVAQQAGLLGPAFTGPVSIVRCQRGALFQTVWIPFASIKAIRLGPFRVQRCPVHDRVELVRRVDPNTLSAAERAAAARYPSGRLP